MQEPELDLNDMDADEPVKPPRSPRRRQGLIGDRMLAATGVAMACSAAMFPWYVFFNPEKFGFRAAPMDHTRDLPETTPRNVFSVSPLALVAREDHEQKPPEGVDPLETATVSDVGRQVPDRKPIENAQQPFPGSAFRLLHVANGRALIEDTSGMFMVQIGSILPDNSRVATLEKRNGKWVIVTTSGQIYENQ
ncbi:flagellar protein [Allorhizobium undicola]|uniref:flagellar protein n=1 Tax=Allorhizobium undicola TaxID=78527 RepID=UPI000A4A4103|nr:flagellar protein [Allorhizobium undicola]